LLLFAIPLREYGLLCSLPVSALLFDCGSRRPGGPFAPRPLAAAIVLSATSLLVHNFVVYDLLGALRLHKTQTLYRYDLAAVYALAGVDFAPRMTREPYRSPGSMRELYEQEQGMWRILYAYEGGIPEGYAVAKDVPERGLTENEVDYYRAAWLKALRAHPTLLMKHKLHVFAIALGLEKDMFGFRKASFFRSRQNVFGLHMRGGLFYKALNRSMKRVEGSLVMKPWPWLLATVILLTAGALRYRRRPGDRHRLTPGLVLLASAALVYPQLLVTALDNDLRFTWWAIVACALAVPLLLVPAPSGAPCPPRGSGLE
jgi:hypothetical protein